MNKWKKDTYRELLRSRVVRFGSLAIRHIGRCLTAVRFESANRPAIRSPRGLTTTKARFHEAARFFKTNDAIGGGGKEWSYLGCRPLNLDCPFDSSAEIMNHNVADHSGLWRFYPLAFKYRLTEKNKNEIAENSMTIF